MFIEAKKKDPPAAIVLPARVEDFFLLPRAFIGVTTTILLENYDRFVKCSTKFRECALCNKHVKKIGKYAQRFDNPTWRKKKRETDQETPLKDIVNLFAGKIWGNGDGGMKNAQTRVVYV